MATNCVLQKYTKEVKLNVSRFQRFLKRVSKENLEGQRTFLLYKAFLEGKAYGERKIKQKK